MFKGIRLILVFLSLTYAAAVSAKTPDVSFKDRVHEITLKNGMTFLVVYRDDVPVFSANSRVKVGGIEEAPGQSGLAHLLEHMAFKGTETIGPEEYVEIYKRNGGQSLNATTSKDRTVYFIDLPQNRLELWAWMEADRFIDPVMREFDLEKQVVIQERRERVDHNPMGKFYERFIQEAFWQESFGSHHPYGVPTIGSVADLQSLTVEDLQAFFDRYYTPKRMVVALVGDLPPTNELKPLLEQTFGRLARPETPEPEWPPLTLDREVRFTMSEDAMPALLIGYPKPTVPSREDIAFDVLQAALCEGDSARLIQSLVHTRQLASEIDCETGIPGVRLEHLFLISAKPFPGVSLESLLAGIDEEVDHLKKMPLSREEVEKAQHLLLSSQVWGLETNSGLADTLTYYQSITGDWRYLVRAMKTLQKVDSQQLQELINRYLRPDRRVVGLMKDKKDNR